MAKSLFAQTILDKIFLIEWRNPVKLRMTYRFQLVNATLNARATQNKGQI